MATKIIKNQQVETNFYKYGAVVTEDVLDYAIVGGNPAKVIRMRK